MAWYRNHYHCGDCGTDWEDEWSCCCDDECPGCGSRNWSPVESEDLTFMIEEDSGAFVISMSPRSAEYDPGYAEIAIAPTLAAATAYVGLRQESYWSD